MARFSLFVPPVVVTIALSVALLGACRESEQKSSASLSDVEDSCGRLPFQQLVGKDGRALSGLAFAQPTRILAPNSIMTMDYRSDRLNIYLDREGKIEKITCG